MAERLVGYGWPAMGASLNRCEISIRSCSQDVRQTHHRYGIEATVAPQLRVELTSARPAGVRFYSLDITFRIIGTILYLFKFFVAKVGRDHR